MSADKPITGTTPFLSRFRAQWSARRHWGCAALVVLLTALGLWAWRAAGQVVAGTGWVSWRIHLLNVAVALAAGLGAGLLVAVVGALVKRRASALVVSAWVASAVLLATMGAAGALRGWWLVLATVLIAVPVVVAAVTAAATGGARRGLLLGGAVSALVVLLVAGLLIWPGPSGPAGVPMRAAGTAAPGESGGSGQPGDPTARGTHDVDTLRYGSGKPGLETAYGPGVDVVTDPVDGSQIISNWSPALTEGWGFDATSLPLNATVWRPRDAGTYPLVVVVHGNATVGSSELGFTELADTLASRGHVVAAIDENFLNTGVLGGATTGLDMARAWLVLEHLRLWRDWSTPSSTNPLSGLASPTGVTLVGHSRGGEAVAVAAAANTAREWPGGAGAVEQEADIASVVAIAPSDGVLVPDGPAVQLEGVNYLTIAGSYDADVLTFAGARQYARTPLGAGQVKSAILLDRMNHSQFNERWGRHDGALGLAKHVLSTGPLVEPAAQRRAALGYVSAFLDLTVGGQRERLAVFADPGVEPSFIGGVARRQQFAEGVEEVLVPDSGGGPQPLATRTGTSDNEVWALSNSASLSYVVPEGRVTRAIRLDLAADGVSQGEVTVALTDRSGRTGRVVVVSDRASLSPLPGQFTKLALLIPAASQEPTLATWTLPAEVIDAAGVDSSQLAGIVIESSGDDRIHVDTVALVRPEGT